MAPPFVAALLTVAFAVSSTKNNVNKQEAKFDRMIDELKLPAATVEFIDSPKQRVLFRGMAAGVADPLIRNAFSIVYKDLAPVRVAGDIIFYQLSAVAGDATERASGVAALPRDGEDAGEEEMDAEALANSRQFFDLLDGDGSGGLDRDELLASPELLAFLRDDENLDIDNVAAVDRFMNLADENGDGVISFVEFANAAAAQPRLRVVDEALAVAFQQASVSGGEGKPRPKRAFGRKSPEDRFESMLKDCLVWEQDLGCAPDKEPESDAREEEGDECVVDVNLKKEDDRLLQVLKGALVGARCEPVVEALKMCYIDYSPLRLGGDIIFKLLKRVVATQIPKTK